MEKGKRPLDGVTVLDFTIALAGPTCTSYLADYGARVIKVETYGKGDVGRGVNDNPKMAGDLVSGGDSFNGFNRNKEGISVDLRNEEAKALLKKMIAKVDVVVSNYRPGVMDEMGFSYEECKKIKPDIIYADIRAYSCGERINDGGMDVVIQARAGTIGFTGLPDGTVCKPGPSMSDMLGGHNCFEGILMALYHKAMTGEGQHVTACLADATMMIMEQYIGPCLNNPNFVMKPNGLVHQEIVPCQGYKSADNYIYIAAGSNKLWAALVTAMGKPEWANDERFLSNDDRKKNKPIMDEALEAIFKTKPALEWEDILTKAGVPNSIIATPRQAFEEAQRDHNDIIQTVHHPKWGDITVAGYSIKMHQNPAYITKPAPRRGEHTKSVLQEFTGISDAEFNRLVEEKALEQFVEE